ncbi:MAG TPA: hypothetical protein PLP29_11325 [Candidatus Ozemobacteraceae bacterium]|nr:hypothetical protein [Candidatus Ozemobacteraceae bacterium]
MAGFHLIVVAPSRSLLEFEAASVCVPGVAGHIGVRTHREPLLVSLGVGLVHIREGDGKETWFGITGGFFEMIDNEATILADQLIPSEEATIASHLEGKPLTIPPEFASEVQKTDLAAALLHRRIHQ